LVKKKEEKKETNKRKETNMIEKLKEK